MERAPSNIIGLRVRELRERSDMTQERLTARCQVLGLDITRTALAKIETLTRGVSDHEVFVIAKALRVQIGELFPSKPVTVKRNHPNPKGPRNRKSARG